MSNVRRSGRRVVYYQHAREYLNQIREAERRRRNTIAHMNSLTLSEDRMVEVLGRNIICHVDKRKIRRSKSAFYGVLSRYSTLSILNTAMLSRKSEEPCTICLMEYDSSKQVRQLKCSHTFHRKCIDRWLQQYLTCPLCRRGILGNHYIFPPGQTSINPPQPEDDIESYETNSDESDIIESIEPEHITDEEGDGEHNREDNGNDDLESVVEHATQREIRVDVLREVFTTGNDETNTNREEDREAEETAAKRPKLSEGEGSSNGAGPSSSQDEDNTDSGEGNENHSNSHQLPESEENNEDDLYTL